LNSQGHAAASIFVTAMRQAEVSHPTEASERRGLAIFTQACGRLASFTDPQARAFQAACWADVRSFQVDLAAEHCAQLLHGSCPVAEQRAFAADSAQLADAGRRIAKTLGRGACQTWMNVAASRDQRDADTYLALANATATSDQAAVRQFEKQLEHSAREAATFNYATKRWLARCAPRE
jgi:hypothetical protein